MEDSTTNGQGSPGEGGNGGDGQSNETQSLVITTLGELGGAVSAAVGFTEKQGRNYTKAGFRGVEGLENISVPVLTQMAGAIIRQIALNGSEDEVKLMLGTQKRPGLLAQYAFQAVTEAEAERQLESYVVVGKDLGIARQPDEPASAYIARVREGYKARA